VWVYRGGNAGLWWSGVAVRLPMRPGAWGAW
jgi:hypothetical protein